MSDLILERGGEKVAEHLLAARRFVGALRHARKEDQAVPSRLHFLDRRRRWHRAAASRVRAGRAGPGAHADREPDHLRGRSAADGRRVSPKATSLRRRTSSRWRPKPTGAACDNSRSVLAAKWSPTSAGRRPTSRPTCLPMPCARVDSDSVPDLLRVLPGLGIRCAAGQGAHRRAQPSHLPAAAHRRVNAKGQFDILEEAERSACGPIPISYRIR